MNAIANLAAMLRADLGECLADLAVDALIDEAELSPAGPGGPPRQWRACRPAPGPDAGLGAEPVAVFQEMADAAQRHGRIDAPARRPGQLGRDGEAAMLRTTEGVNTHRGAIWALGLLVAAAARTAPHAGRRSGRARRTHRPARRSGGRHRRQPRRARPSALRRRRRPRGGASRLPRAVRHGLPQLWRSREGGAGEQNARLDALLAIMSVLDDTCVLHRAGRVGLAAMQDGARAVLAAGGSASLAGRRRLCELDRRLLALNASPGGAADLLAACLFLDRLPAVSGGWAGSL